MFVAFVLEYCEGERKYKVLTVLTFEVTDGVVVPRTWRDDERILLLIVFGKLKL